MSCPDWLLQILAVESFDRLAQIATILWGIWSARNQKVWESKTITAQTAIEWSKKIVTEWQEARQRRLGRLKSGVQGGSRGLVRWKAPEEGKLKVNVDASVVPGASSFSAGMVLRDHHGSFLKARNIGSAGEVPVFEAEAWGVLQALRWIQSLPVSEVEVECDSLLTVSALHKRTEFCLEVGFILADCISILCSRPDITVSFVKKQANKVAHLLARVPCLVNSSNDFLSPPPSVLETLLYDSFLN